jgi:ATP/maltotriose-dependent transcriptional regulator MalT
VIRLRLADVLFRQGDGSGARHEVELALRRSRSERETLFGSVHESLFATVMIADIERQSGDLDRARALRDEALAAVEAAPSPHVAHGHMLAVILAVSAKVDLADGQVAEAGERLAQAFPVAVGTRDMPIVATVGIAVAMYAAATGRLEEAGEILGAAAQVRGADDPTAPDIKNLVAVISAELGADVLAAAQARGRGLARDMAIARCDPAQLVR